MKQLLYILTALLLVSCDGFVDIVPKGSVIPSTVDDLGKMINSMQTSGNTTLAVMTDDVSFPDEDPFYAIGRSTQDNKNAYLWGTPHIYNVNADDPTWNELYKSIYVCNYILENIENAEPGADYDRDEVKGSALVHRTTSYFALNQLYAKHYNPSTAETDLSIPLRLISDINTPIPRSTVANVYKQMITDLETAYDLVPEKIGKYNDVPSKPAVLGMLTRISLFMGDYDKAYDYATQAINMVEKGGEKRVMDYRKLTPKFPGFAIMGVIGYPASGEAYSSPEIIYSRKSINSVGLLSRKIVNLFGVEDLRLTTFCNAPKPGVTTDYWDGFQRPKQIGIDVYELYITKAETTLRKSSPNINEAIQTLDYLRIKRISETGYSPTTETNHDKLLLLILDERHKEFFQGPIRLFDMKRLDADPKTAQEYSRISLGKEYKLEINSPYLVLPIPQKIVDLGGYQQNPAPGR